MDVIEKASVLTLYLLLTAAVFGDFRSGRVSNRLIVTGLAAAVLLRGVEGGFVRILGILPNLLIPVILLFLFYVCGAIGAGDIKLLSMIGGFFEMNRLIRCIGLSLAAGAVWSLLHLLCKRRFLVSLQRVCFYVFSLAKGERAVYESEPDSRICFTAAILIGAVLSGMGSGQGGVLW